MSEIIIVDYGVGNIGSIINMLKKIGVSSKLSSNIDDIEKAKKLLLPGVGSFDNGMKSLKSSGLIDLLHKKVLVDKTPILGICLGMQLLLNSSEEGSEKGLGWISGKVVKFDFGNNPKNLKVPHMGWNVVNPLRRDSLYSGFESESRFYFVHSYHVVCDDEKNRLASTDYGYEFTSSICKDNIYGAQFHPEKSHKFGMRLLKNFSEIC